MKKQAKKSDIKSTSKTRKTTKRRTKKTLVITTPDIKKHLVLDCMVMRFSEKESLAYLKSKGEPLQRARFYEIKQEIENNREHDINKIALENGFAESHLAVINSFRTIERELWINYHRESEPLKKATILRHIMESQVYLADAYDVTKEIIREQAHLKEKMAIEIKN